MKTKKLIVLLLAALMVFTFFGCASTTHNEASADATTQEETEKETLVAAMNADFAPYEYMEGEEFMGIDVEIAKAIGEKLDMNIEFQNVQFSSIIAGVQTGKYDMGISGITVTEERKTQVNFTESYASGVQVVVVKEGSEISSPDDLATLGSTISVQLGTTGDIYACDDFGEENVQEYNTYSDCVEALISGKVDCIIMDNEPAKAVIEANEGLAILDTAYVTEDYAIALNLEDTELLEKINSAINELKEEGTIDTILNKYINAEG